MSHQGYWKEFWNKNMIIEREGIHEKVGRTVKGIAIEQEKWDKTLSYLEGHLDLSTHDDVLDIAAGSGAIAIPFCEKVHSYTALDISEKLLENLKQFSRIKTLHADAMEADLGKEHYTKVIVYFALQHFSENESGILIEKIYRSLKPGGICFIGDIPDIQRKFAFFDTPERKKAYLDSENNNRPIIGSWFEKKTLQDIGSRAGFRSSLTIDQPPYQINAHYRFDLKLIK
jgi:ubiquinone/menaquinone biosynthesis C-methylase UbiE